MTPPTNEEVRRQFEAWAASYGMYRDRDASDGSYVSDNTHDAWEGYQAALSSPAVVALVEALRHCEDMLMRYEIDRVDGEQITGSALTRISAALAPFTTGAGHVE